MRSFLVLTGLALLAVLGWSVHADRPASIKAPAGTFNRDGAAFLQKLRPDAQFLCRGGGGPPRGRVRLCRGGVCAPRSGSQ